MTPDQASLAHWGTAAFLFSLDLSDGLAQLAVPNTPVDQFRLSARNAILANRDAIETGHNAIWLRSAIAAELADLGLLSALDPVVDWIDGCLPTAARPQNGVTTLIAPLSNLDHLRRIDDAFDFAPLEGAGYAAVLFGQVDSDASDCFCETAFAADDKIDSNDLSDWDTQILTRNAELYGVDNPLAMMIDGIRLGLLRSAATRVSEAVGPDKSVRLLELCQSGGQTT